MKIPRLHLSMGSLIEEHKEYHDLILSGKFPDKAPESFIGKLDDRFTFDPIKEMSLFALMDILRGYGLYVLIDNTWLKTLAEYLKGKKCLEIMAGGGFVSYGLRKLNINCVATDVKDYKSKFYVEIISAMKAVEKFGKYVDVLIVVWPPYDDPHINEVMNKWGTEKEVVYIGEWGGCTADDTFHDSFTVTKVISKYTWKFLHDKIYIGKWNPELCPKTGISLEK